MRLQLYACIAVAISYLLTMPARADETLLRISLEQSIDDRIGQNLVGFKKEVEAKTNGAIKVNIFDKGQFYLEYQVPDAVGSGAIEMGVAPLARYAEEAPAAGLFMQPFLFNYDAIVRAAAKRGGEIRNVIDAEIEKRAGAHVLWWQPYGPDVIFAKGSAANPQAIANRNIRVFNDLSGEFVRLCGGTPHVISLGKQIEAFDQNIIDSSMSSIAIVKDFDLWKKTNTITNIRHSEILFLVVINSKIWQSLTPDLRNILTQAATKAEEDIWSNYGAYVAETFAYAAQKGMKVQQLTPQDTIAWRICSSPILESYMARAGTLGAKLFAAYGKLRADPCCAQASSSIMPGGR